MLKKNIKKSGYVCVPYQHDKFSIGVKDMWDNSRNIKSIYFVAATFADECKPYFPSSTNHYLLAKFYDEEKLIKDAEKFTISKPSFVFTVDKYNDPDAISDVANTIVKKDKIRQAGFAHLNLFCANTPKFVFPHTEKIVILEVSDERSPQSINQYCQKMRQDISRKGVVMNNFVSISLLEKLK